MSKQYVPDDIRDFILKHIVSVAQIETLLLIWASPGERWGLRQIAARIYTSDAEMAKALDGLCAQGLLVCSDGVFNLNRSEENLEMIRKLQEVYARHLIPVTDVIHGKSGSAASTGGAFRPVKD
jgi:DNA-binding MarR family transcriptional regulator